MFQRFSQILLLFLCLSTMLGSSVTLLVAAEDGIVISLDSGWEEEPGETDPLPDQEKLIPFTLTPVIVYYLLDNKKLVSYNALFPDYFERDVIAPPPEFRAI